MLLGIRQWSSPSVETRRSAETVAGGVVNLVYMGPIYASGLLLIRDINVTAPSFSWKRFAVEDE